MRVKGLKRLTYLLPAVFVLLATVLMVAEPESPSIAMPVAETTSTPGYELAALHQPASYEPFIRAKENIAQQKAAEYIAAGVDTMKEIKYRAIDGRVYEILVEYVKAKEAERAAARAAARKSAPQSNVTLSSASSPGAAEAGQWAGSYAEWDAIAIQTLAAAGCTQSEIDMMMYIHHHEGGPNSISPSGKFYGGWQLNRDMALGNPWWDPVWSTNRALQYVMGHSYKGYGKGIAAAYNHKIAYDWY